MRASAHVVAGLALLMAGPSADAALHRYNIYTVQITEAPQQDPNPNNTLPLPVGQPPVDVGMVEATANPQLRKLMFRHHYTTTINVPSLTTTIFIANFWFQGPRAPDLRRRQGVPQVSFTGTGSTNNGSSIRWGIITGWTITGQSWCNSNPGVICSLATLMDEETSDPRHNSDFYDLGTWFFHGTGFTSIPFVHSYFTSSFGNNQYALHAKLEQAFSVPALPAIGLLVLGGSIVLGGVAATRRRGSR